MTRDSIYLLFALVALVAGCAHVPNQFRETGPAVSADWDSPSAADILARYAPSEPRRRDWPVQTVAARSGAIAHWPLYFEDPFEDKGDGRTDETHARDVHRLGWEDYMAFPYCFARFTANWLMLPVSALVTPPWTVMESDGHLSRQLLGYDHDAVPLAPWPGLPIPPVEQESPRATPADAEPQSAPPATVVVVR